MMKDWYRKLWFVGLLALFLSPLMARADAIAALPGVPPAPLQPAVGTALRADSSPPLREMPVISSDVSPEPRPEVNLPLPNFRLTSSGVDPVIQSTLGPLAMPAPLYSFDGVNNVNGVHPPDTQGDIGYDPATGTKYYVQWVNLSFAIWDVTDPTPTRIYGPVNGNTLWQGFGGVCETTNHGDPITLFDTMANRWLMSQFSLNGPYYQCIAISQTADPTGAWYRYAFQVSATKMNDYPHFGVWPDGYYMTVNQFTGGTSWGGAGVFVFERDKMLTGDPSATFQSFDLYSVNPNFGGMLPSDLDGATLPPTGAPNYFMEVDNSPDEIKLWRFHVDWDTPANSTFGVNGQPNAVLATAAWTPIGYNIPQPGTSYNLDNLGDRLMYRLAYRNYGTHETLVVNHTVDASGRAGVRWYEVRDPNGTPVIYQQSTFSPDSDHRWMGSIAMDAAGNMALGYSVSSSSVYPSVRYTGRLANDPLNQMPQGEGSLVVGSGVQQSPYSRWGDYSMMGIDPVDDCTFWFTEEYMQTTGYSSWSTRIGAFRFPNCTQAQPGTLAGVVIDAATNAPLHNVTVAAQGAGTAESTVSAPDGSYALSLAAGAYTVTAQTYGYQPYRQTNVTVNEGFTTTLNIPLTPAPMVVVSGVVSDALTGWPLYAQIRVTGSPFNPPAPNDAVWSDPVTGFYQVTLASGSTYTFTVEPWADGYNPAVGTVGPLASNVTRNFALQPNLAVCAAPGYTLARTAAYEADFAGGLPAGATLVDNAGDGVFWRFNDPRPRGNLTGGTGAFAIVDSDYERTKDVDAELRLPALDLSALSSVILEFKYDFRWYSFGESETADVDISVNGGVTWSNVWRRSGASDRGPKTARVDISGLAANKPDVRIRFHYYNANYEWWWQVDDVFVGAMNCSQTVGGLVVGEVRDGNTQAAVFARVSSAAASVVAESSGTTGSGAFYTLFVPAAAHTITATASGYGTVVLTPPVVPGAAVRQNIILPAGQLQAAGVFAQPIVLEADTTATRYLTLTNAGGYSLDFTVQPVNAPAPGGVTGPFAVPVRRNSPKHLQDLDARSVRNYTPPTVPAWPGGEVVLTWTTNLTSPWGIVVLPDETVWINDARFGGGQERYYHFSPDGIPTGDERDTFPQVAIFAADMTYDPVAHTVWQVNVGEDNCIYELDAATFAATGRAICPKFGLSVRGLAYDPATQTFFAGSWNDQILYHFDTAGRILDSWDTALNLAGMAYNPVSGHLFVLSNAGAGHDVYVLDTRNAATILGGFDIAGLGNYEQAGLALDAAGYLWTVNQITGEVFKVTLGEPLAPWDQVSWLTTTPLTGTIGVGGQQPLTLTLDAAGMLPGDYPAHLRINNSAPYGPLNLPVTMTVVYRYNVAVGPAAQVQTVAPGAMMYYTLWVTNTGLETDSYTITVTGDNLPTSAPTNNWPVNSPTTVGPLAAGASASLPVTVTVPPNALCGARHLITVTVTSRASVHRVAQAYLTSIVSAVYGVSAAPVSSSLSGDPGETVYSTVIVTNTGNCRDTFEVSTAGRWPSPVLTPTVTISSGASALAALQVRIPKTAQAGESAVTRLTVQSVGGPAQSTTALLTVTANAVYSASLSPAVATQDGFIGADVVYAFELANLGNGADTFTLSTHDDQWPVVLAPRSVTLAADDPAPVVLTVTVPITMQPGAQDVFTLVATGSSGAVSSTITTTAVVSYGVQLRADPPAGEMLPGMPLTYTLWVTNTGGIADTFDLTVSGNVWTTTVVTTVGPLASGAGVSVAMRVDVPASVAPGAADTALIAVTSQMPPAVSTSLAVTTTAVDCLPVRGPSFTYTPERPIAGQAVTFTGAVASGTLPITYTWNFGGGALAEGQVVTHTFAAETAVMPYPVVMTATNACGQVWVQETVIVRLYQVYLPLAIRTSD